MGAFLIEYDQGELRSQVRLLAILQKLLRCSRRITIRRSQHIIDLVTLVLAAELRIVIHNERWTNSEFCAIAIIAILRIPIRYVIIDYIVIDPANWMCAVARESD
jgi:hypothetical protein